MYDQQDQLPDRQEYHKYVVVCVDDFCQKYGIRNSVRSKFGLSNQVDSIDEDSFERIKGELGCGKRMGEDEKVEDGVYKRHCHELENSIMEGSTLEVLSQDLLWSQQEFPSELIVSEDINTVTMENDDTNVLWDPSMTILESERQQASQDPEPEPELLQSDEFHRVSSPPSAVNF
ncbi:hypothetical protein ZYGR_0H01830 [Zygosaccharomyces rouxii]|uniref:Uncharacterized protein n=1 Tax=Zygosaccharomyces rouxii TaxID=4956 RepID=A0A1Q2ZUZ9_ZYGRO|nr:hypothetical protein ZYGR_0H01830 [Zygosaccharomyces rouxii]